MKKSNTAKSNVINFQDIADAVNAERDTLASLNGQLEACQASGDEHLGGIVAKAAEHCRNAMAEHAARVAKVTKMLNEKKIAGWQIIGVFVAGNGTFGNFAILPRIYRTYDDAKASMARFLAEAMKGIFRDDDLVPGSYHVEDGPSGEEPDDSKPYYMVAEITDIGQDWHIPLVRYASAEDAADDPGCCTELYIRPLIVG